VGGKGFFFPKLCLVWRMDCPLFIVHLDNGLLTFYASLWVGGRGGEGSKLTHMGTTTEDEISINIVLLRSNINSSCDWLKG